MLDKKAQKLFNWWSYLFTFLSYHANYLSMLFSGKILQRKNLTSSGTCRTNIKETRETMFTLTMTRMIVTMIWAQALHRARCLSSKKTHLKELMRVLWASSTTPKRPVWSNFVAKKLRLLGLSFTDRTWDPWLKMSTTSLSRSQFSIMVAARAAHTTQSTKLPKRTPKPSFSSWKSKWCLIVRMLVRSFWSSLMNLHRALTLTMTTSYCQVSVKTMTLLLPLLWATLM